MSTKSKPKDSGEFYEGLYQKIWKEKNDFIQVDEATGAEYIKPMFGFERGIMVREQYLQLWDAVRNRRERLISSEYLDAKRGLVITGQPGIGKTLFLTYALLRALKDHIPVVYYISNARFLIFSEAGYERRSTPTDVPYGALCLVDSNSELISPPVHLSNPIYNSFVVQAASPQPKRWEEWSEQIFAEKWVMGVWTKDEMSKLEQLRNKLAPTTSSEQSDNVPRYTLSELYDIIGPAPRYCVRYSQWLIKTTNGPKIDFPYEDPRALFKNPKALVKIFETGDAPLWEQGQGFHRFFFVTNCNHYPNLTLPRFKYSIPTKYLHSLVADHYRRQHLDRQMALLSKSVSLSQAVSLSQVAGIFYEPLVLDLLSDPLGALPCHLYGETVSPSFQIGPGLSSQRYTVDPNAGAITPVDNQIYVLQAGYPSLDAFIVSENKTRVTMLQMTVSARQQLKLRGIRMVIDALKKGGLPDDESVKWSILLVTPDDRGQKITDNLQEVITGFGRNYPKIELGWLVVGPEIKKHTAIMTTVLQALNKSSPKINEVDTDVIDEDVRMEEW